MYQFIGVVGINSFNSVGPLPILPFQMASFLQNFQYEVGYPVTKLNISETRSDLQVIVYVDLFTKLSTATSLTKQTCAHL